MNEMHRSVIEALYRLAGRIQTVSHESIDWKSSKGRYLFEDIAADRDSPACDVSAMDGYAIRLSDLVLENLPLAGTIAAGSKVFALPDGHAIQIFTGAPVPIEADCVIRREDTHECPDGIRISSSIRAPRFGENIRRQGENVRSGSPVLEIGSKISAASMAAIASFGYSEFDVYRKVRVVVLNTGDEIRGIDDSVEDWQIRDSNGPCLEMMLQSEPSIELVARVRVADDLNSIQKLLRQWLPEFDAIILTGGVSMGDSDHVPEAIRRAGCDVIFHKIPIRPGKPLLGAVGPDGQLILGLPGNPASVMVTCRRMGLPLLRKMAGARDWECRPTSIQIENPDDRTLDLVWYRLVRLVQPGIGQLLDTRGSGDIASLAQSDGVIELLPQQQGVGPWNFYPW